MTPERWRQVDRLYKSALKQGGDQRSAFLKQACGGDEALLREVESLFVTQESVGKLPIPPLESVPNSIAEEPAIGRLIGSYKILALLGEGGMGQVYRARDSRLGREVALKILPPVLRFDPERMQRFVREARAASALNHPNVAHIYELGDAEGVSFIAMEYVTGQTLQSKMTGDPLDVPFIVEIGIQVTDALDEAHSKEIIHRDIKPANLMLTPRGQLKVLDFGLAKFAGPEADSTATSRRQTISTPGAVMGTVPYMSPEQLLGREVDNRTDIFSLGVVLYEMTTGRLPFAGASPSERMDHTLHSQPEAIARFNYSVPPELERVIRKCLEKDPERRFQSARELLVDLKNLKRDSESGVATPSRIPDAAPPKPLKSRRLVALSAVAAAIAGIVIYLSMFRRMSGIDLDIKSLAVLPLENLSSDMTQDYLADGITEALIADLAKINALRVMSRSSVMRYKGTRKPPAAIARELKVDALVEGSVMRSETRVRVTAQLVHAGTEKLLWGESYERDLRDILKVQNEVVRMVAGEIKVKLSSQEAVRIARVASVDPEAYDYYLRGRYYSHRGTKLDNETAIGMLERAATLDPGFAAAHAELASVYWQRPFFFAPEEKQWEAKAAASAEKALSLDPDSAEGYVARGRVLWTRSNHFPHEGAVQEFRRAISVSPNSDEAHANLAVVYNHIGLLDRGLHEAEEALTRDPNSVGAKMQIANSLLWQGKYQEAVAAWRSLPGETNPSVVGSHSAWALFQLGRNEEAVATIDEFSREHPEDTGGLLTGMRALMLAAKGEERLSEREITRAIQKRAFGHFHHTAHYIASAYARMNKPDLAIYWLQEAAETGFPCYPLFEHDVNLNSLRETSRFAVFMNELKKQWEHYNATL
jgi:serine/threonine protein kinase/tetratricopeptide (TPR) repeat protein